METFIEVQVSMKNFLFGNIAKKKWLTDNPMAAWYFLYLIFKSLTSPCIRCNQKNLRSKFKLLVSGQFLFTLSKISPFYGQAADRNVFKSLF